MGPARTVQGFRHKSGESAIPTCKHPNQNNTYVLNWVIRLHLTGKCAVIHRKFPFCLDFGIFGRKLGV